MAEAHAAAEASAADHAEEASAEEEASGEASAAAIITDRATIITAPDPFSEDGTGDRITEEVAWAASSVCLCFPSL